jgi:hypothetical protein
MDAGNSHDAEVLMTLLVEYAAAKGVGGELTLYPGKSYLHLIAHQSNNESTLSLVIKEQELNAAADLYYVASKVGVVI